ncbi:MAG: NADH-quinone oxidoreductase subunit NuoG [Proteobacteria bacterium]|nr:NADH-quinone oxidoreductase subunit NuoG [Pseudomonadota bacterium]
MTTINIDGSDYEVAAGENLLKAALSHHQDLPYFCWHPSLGSVGACRQCAVVQYQNPEDTRGRLVMACMTPVVDGMRVSVKAPNAVGFRAGVIEWLMENHPHDCPVCEEGGECHLQDMTVMTGHTSRRYRGQKRTFENQYLGPFLNHEMNRCITCYRCVRYYRDYAGGTDLQALGSRDRMYFGRFEDGVLDNIFAGNLVEVCPTGVFTDKPFSRTYTRKWDLQSAPSVCQGCSAGCNIFASERYGKLKRVHNRYHKDINGYFLCDRGRFGSSFVNSDLRLRQAGVRIEADLFQQVSIEAATQHLRDLADSGDVVGIGSPRASLEDNFALMSLVGEANFSCGMNDVEAAMMDQIFDLYAKTPDAVATITALERADVTLVFGDDPMNAAPRVALAIRQAARNVHFDMAVQAGVPTWQDAGVRGHAQHALSPLYIATPLPTGLDDVARQTSHAAPADLAVLGLQIADQIASPPSDDAEGFVANIARDLLAAQHPTCVCGTASAEPAVMQAFAAIITALIKAGRKPQMLCTSAEVNSFGVRRFAGLSLQGALDRMQQGSNAMVLQNDLYRREIPAMVSAALAGAGRVLVLDSFETATANAADIVLPVTTYAEHTGTVVNCEGRAQRAYQVFEAEGQDIQPAWRWLSDFEHIDDVLHACAALPAFEGLEAVSPEAGYRTATNSRVPRATHRFSGRTAATAHVSVHEPKTSVDTDTPFSFSMEGENTGQAGALIPYVWSPGWNSNQSLFKFQQEVGGSLTGGEPGVRLGFAPSKSSADGSASSRTKPATGEVNLIPHPQTFGSDELSSLVGAIVERCAPPTLWLNPDDARALGLSSRDGATWPDAKTTYLVQLSDQVTPGNALASVGVGTGQSVLPRDAVTLIKDSAFTPPPDLIARG